MLESGVSPELCRNGKPNGKSDTAPKSLSSKSPLTPQRQYCPRSRVEGIFMAVTAEAPIKIESIDQPPVGEYARSHRTLWRWGGALAVGAEVAKPYETLTFNDYTSALREMLRTDAEYREKLDLEDEREHDIIDGVAVAADGTPMHELIADGRRTSQVAALASPELQAQVVRDQGDEYNAHKVDAMMPGQTRYALSMEPKNELKGEHRKKYLGLGYRDNLAFLQTYSRTADGTLIAASYSIDMSDEKTWKALFADLGAEVPDDISPNTWIKHGFEREHTPEQAADFARTIRQDYYNRSGVTGQRYSVTEYLAHNAATVCGLFNAYYPSLAQAVHSGKNNETLQGFARAVLTTDLQKMKPETKQQLKKVANSQEFDTELGKTMDEIIRYAVVEELREGLASAMRPSGILAPQKAGTIAVKFVTAEHMSRINPVEWSMRLAKRIVTGIKAGRSYGGCSSIKLNSEEFNDMLDELNQGVDRQDAYGGRGKSESKEKDVMYCVNCPKCGTEHKEVRKGKDGYFCCKDKKCGYKVKAS